MATSLLQQLKNRRLKLGLKQNDMKMRIGVSRQQYQRLESKGNPRLDTLEMIAKGLNSELMLIPREKLLAVKALLENAESVPAAGQETSLPVVADSQKKSLVDDPWQGLLL